jgi:hypothetical protein
VGIFAFFFFFLRGGGGGGLGLLELPMYTARILSGALRFQ